jgi:hypothetical protein
MASIKTDNDMVSCVAWWGFLQKVASNAGCGLRDYEPIHSVRTTTHRSTDASRTEGKT